MATKIIWIKSAHGQNANLLQHFLSYLLHGSSKPKLKKSSIGQDIIYCVHNGQFITPKHVLLPFSIKSITGIIKITEVINRLGHGASYTKFAEVDAAYAIQKIATNSGLVPEEIQLYQQASMFYDNIDRSEEILSGAGTTDRVNEIVIQKASIGPKLIQNFIDKSKSKQRSLYVQPFQLPVYRCYQIWTSIWILLLKECKARKTLYGFHVEVSTKKNKISVGGQDFILKSEEKT